MNATEEKPDLESAKARIGDLLDDVITKAKIYQDAEEKLCEEIISIIVARMQYIWSHGIMVPISDQFEDEYNVNLPFGLYRIDREDNGCYYDILLYNETVSALYLVNVDITDGNDPKKLSVHTSSALMDLLRDLERVGYFNDEYITDFIN